MRRLLQFECDVCRAVYFSSEEASRCEKASVPPKPLLGLGDSVAVRVRTVQGDAYVRRVIRALYVQNVTGNSPGEHEWAAEVDRPVRLHDGDEPLDTVPTSVVSRESPDGLLEMLD